MGFVYGMSRDLIRIKLRPQTPVFSGSRTTAVDRKEIAPNRVLGIVYGDTFALTGAEYPLRSIMIPGHFCLE
ncbi:hypothetical protein QUF72_03720 [Desulfobacterales bacterium HSG2]|nr:hypothetical protein [Desulfobacterales bacterium HSG2]